MTKITYIPGEIANAAIDEHGNRKPVTRTQHIFDDAKGKSQAEVNAEVDDTLALHQSEINALDIGNYVTVDTYSELPSTGSIDTIYRVCNWDGSANDGEGAVDGTVYSLYAWDSTNSEYKLLCVRTQIGEVFDISLWNAVGGVLATYDYLADALGVNGANIPAGIRKGGMSVKYVQSSDNNYIRYNLLATSFTTDITKWAIDDAGVYVKNPEFIRVVTDKDGRILACIKTDGSIDWAVGVPKPVREYVEVVLDTKVDKEENKSLIDEDFANGISYIENPEFICVSLDSENKVLFGVQKDGNFLFGAGVPQQVIRYIESRIADLSLDEYEDIVAFLSGLEEGDKTLQMLLNEKVDKEEGKSLIDADYASAKSTIESPEYISVETDTEGRVLSGRRIDGTKFENMPIEISNVRIEGIADLEDRIEVKTDSERRIISYRDKDGVLHENIGIETPNVNTQEVNASSINSTTVSTETIDANEINLPPEGLTELGQALKDNGFYAMGMSDFSNIKNVELPEPKHYGIINLIISSLPIEDEDVSKGYVEYYDFYGNYFKKKCKVESQGQSSKNFARTGGKGNYTLKIDDTIKSKVKFGSWVPQKSWHLKGCAKDVTRGYLSTSYKWAYMMMQALDASPIRNLTDDASITTTQATGDRLTDWPTDARCIPDGFPVEIYINGEYWGLYALQLQKKSENYAMDEDDYESLIIDADLLMTENSQGISVGGFWSGDIWWDKFEIRNPEPLICMDGTEYDGDNPKELIDSTSANYDANNPDHVNSAIAKGVIEGFSTKYLAVQDLIDNNNLADAKELFAQYFDVNSCILVYIFNCLTRNRDSINKNTLWGTWNNGKVVPLLWDLDCVYGEEWIGVNAAAPTSTLWTGRYAQSEWPLGQLWTLYETELKAAYASLRSNGIISVETWHDVMVKNWIERIGKEAYDRDIKKWKETPSYRKNYTNTSYWTENNTTTSPGVIQEWNNQTAYSIGDKVTLRQYDTVNSWMVYTAVAASDANNPQCPVTKFYTGFPKVGGYYNSYKRIEKWLEEQISLSDSVMGYNS